MEQLSFICAPITETSATGFINAISEASQKADAIELRLDHLSDEDVRIVLSELPKLADKPLILTFRPREQGGMRDLSLDDRLNFWRGLSDDLKKVIAYADFELDLVESLKSSEATPIVWKKIICSHHNFDETPTNLHEVYERMARTPAGVIKIATKANRIGDCLPLFELIERRDATRPVIILGMGLPGLATRVLALSRGAMLTFGALRRGSESAGGQPTIDELRNLYRVKDLTPESEIYGVIGHPIGHSRSPLMHNAALKALNRNGVYLPFEVDDVGAFVRDVVRPATKKLDWRLRGLSVTIPHKLAIKPHLDFIDQGAVRIGSVNTVVVKGDELWGYNTDLSGSMKPLEKLIDVRGARAAVIGAGGSARAICYGLSVRGADLTIYARDPAQARQLAAEFNSRSAPLEQFSGEADLIINCTPVGMKGHSEGQSPINPEKLGQVKLVYDLIYNPEETALLRDARAAGCRTFGGLTMLVGQAAEQVRLWTGEEAPIDAMWQAVVR